MSAVGTRKGTLVLTRAEPPRFRSWWCRLFGHGWVGYRESQAGRLLYKHVECNECGAEETWEHFEKSEARKALAGASNQDSSRVGAGVEPKTQDSPAGSDAELSRGEPRRTRSETAGTSNQERTSDASNRSADSPAKRPS